MYRIPIFAAALVLLSGCVPPYQSYGDDDDDDNDDQSIEGDEAGECDDGVDNDQDGLTDCADPGCVAASACTGDDDDDETSDDDDTGDDDVTSDDDDDDDTGDDDDDTWPTAPYGFAIDVGLTASGGPAGGAATVEYDHLMFDGYQNPLCTTSLEFAATYTYGINQGPEFWQFIDEIVTWTSGAETSNNCPPEWAIYEDDPADWFEWYMHPMAFVSCELIGNAGPVAQMFVAEDDSGYIGVTDGTFEDFCDNVGPAYESAIGSGPMEGVWLHPGMSGDLDPLGDFGYFAAPSPGDPSAYDSWMLLGLLMAATNNYAEPTPGLDGDYVTVPFWLWIY